jgi:hypothetical protein
VTRSDLEQAVYRRLDKNTSSVDTATQTRIRHFLNQRHRRILATPGMSLLRETTTTFPSVAGTSSYSVTAARIKRVWETDNDRVLQQISLDEYRRLAPDAAATAATPWGYALGNHAAGVFTLYLHPQPTSAITYTLDITAAVSDFSGDSGVPLLPDEFHYLLELGASMDELAKTDDERYGVWAREYAQGLDDLHYWVAIHAKGSNTPYEKPSQLGPWYPSGT